MRILKTLAAAATAAFLMVSPALAAEPPPPPDPAKVAAARAQADDAIARLNLAGQFENATNGQIGELRHKASGMVCSLGDEPAEFSVVLNPGRPAGDDVTCSYKVLGPISWRAVRPGGKPSTKDALKQELQSLDGFQKVAVYRGPIVSAQTDLTKKLDIAVLRLTAVQDGKPVFIRISAMVVGDWVYVQKQVVAKDDSAVADLFGEIETVLMVVRLMGVAG